MNIYVDVQVIARRGEAGPALLEWDPEGGDAAGHA
jgi:hypothetical protein